MARAPDYSFERKERARLKAAKTAEKNAARRSQRETDQTSPLLPGGGAAPTDPES